MDPKVRGIQEQLWRQVRSHAALRGVTTGEMLNQIIADWMAAQEGIAKPKQPRQP